MNIPAFIEQLIDHEGEKLKPYIDTVGKTSIGIGRNLTDRGISKDESRFLVNNDITEVTTQLDRNLPWWRNLDEIRQRVIADMCFNMGIATLLTFGRTLDLIRSGDYSPAAANMRASLWAKQTGRRAERLARMMEEGTV